MLKLQVLKPQKEYVILRKARKNHVCHECNGTIPKGIFYIEDHISYIKHSKKDGHGYFWRVTNKICLLCWKGIIPKERSVFKKVLAKK